LGCLLQAGRRDQKLSLRASRGLPRFDRRRLQRRAAKIVVDQSFRGRRLVDDEVLRRLPSFRNVAVLERECGIGESRRVRKLRRVGFI
jgi:hypothetical protein